MREFGRLGLKKVIAMRDFLKRYPLWAVFLILLACVHFEYHGQDWSLGFPGMIFGVAVLVIVGTVLFFRVFNRIQDICVARGLIGGPLHYRYDILIPVAVVAPLPACRNFGDVVQHGVNEGKFVWEFVWGVAVDGWLYPAFVASVIAVAFLLRVHTLLKTIAENEGSTGGP